MSVCIYFCFFLFLFSEPSDQLVPGNVCTRHEKINAISITLSAEHYEIIEWKRHKVKVRKMLDNFITLSASHYEIIDWQGTKVKIKR